MKIKSYLAVVAAGTVLVGSLAVGAAPAQAVVGYNGLEGPFATKAICLHYQNALMKDDPSLRISKQCWTGNASGRWLWYFNTQS